MDKEINNKIEKIKTLQNEINEIESFVKGCDECNAMSIYNAQNYPEGLSITYFVWTGSDGNTLSVKLSKVSDITNFIEKGKDGLLPTLHSKYEELNNLLA